MSYYRQGPFRGGGQGVVLGVPPLTPAVKGLMIACGAVWLIQLLAYRGYGLDLSRLFGAVPGMIVRLAVWQPFTYMFLHSLADPFHLIFNMLMLWMFGGELERYWGPRGFLVYYGVCGVGGGLAATALGLALGRPGVATIGASGALFGLFVAYGIVFAERTILFMLIFPMKARTMAWVMVVLNLLYLLSQGGADNVSYVAHLGGALAGFLYLKRAWRLGAFVRELRWRVRRRRFKVMPPKEPDDRWLH